jgi:hypothetical protein
MKSCESRSGNNILDINNIIESFTQEFKKSYNEVKLHEITTSKKDKINDISTNISKGPKENNLMNGQTKNKNKTINPNSTPIEFYYEFQEYIKGGKNKKSKKINKSINKNKKELNNKNNGNDMLDINILDDISQSFNNNSKKNEKNDLFDNNKHIHITKKNCKSHRNLLMKDNKKDKNLKNSGKIIYRNEDRFWNKIKHYIALKNEHLSQLTYRYKITNSNCGDNRTSKKLNKSSVLLSNRRKPLYPYHTNNEDSLSKNFEKFYKFYQKEQNINKQKLYKKTKNIINKLNSSTNFNKQKFQDFYDKKMNWIKKRDNKINSERNIKEEKNRQFMNSFSFKPHIDKKSIQLINKRNTFFDFMEKKPNTERNYEIMMANKKEIYQKYLATVKPFMAYQFENNSPFFKKKSHSFTKKKPKVDIGMIHVNKGKIIVIIKDTKKNDTNGTNNTNISNNNTNKKINKNNISYNDKKNIFNIFKPDKKHLANNKITNLKKYINKENIYKGKIANGSNNIKNKIWWEEIKQNKVNKEKQNLDYNDLYKVNIRDNCSWNKICINEIFSKPRDKEIINDFI